MNKPFKTYPGGKAGDGVYQSIINRMPFHDIYIELFLGGGSIFAKKKPAKKSILIDIDSNVTAAWAEIQLPPGTSVINTDAISFLHHFKVLADIFKIAGLETFIYADPPYPITSRSSQRNIYANEMTDNQHRELLQVLAGIDADVMISTYPNELYQQLLGHWSTHTFTAQTRNKQKAAKEVIYMNYPTPSQLHDYRYLGDNYRERERLKNIIKRSASKFMQMPAVERNALIEQLKQYQIF